MSKVKEFRNLDEAIREEERKEQAELTSAEWREEGETEEKPFLTAPEQKRRKARKTRFAVAAFVLLLGIGVMGNWYYENSDFSAAVKPVATTSQTKTLGEAEYVGGQAEVSVQSESEYFSSARMERQNARDAAMEKLQAVLDNDNSTADAKKTASESISELSNYISIENKIETLVTAKGAAHCLAVISEDGSRVDVIVDVSELSDTLIVQIKEIAMQQLGCSFENVSIIQSKQ